MSRLRFAPFASWLFCGAVALSLFATVAPCGATRLNRVPVPAASLYRYQGVVYDRLFSVNPYARFALGATHNATLERTSSLPGTPYAITNLAAVFTGSDGPLTGFPTAINNGGLIAFYDTCQCFGGLYDYGNAGIVTDDRGDELSDLLGVCCARGSNLAIPYAINDAGYSTGEWSYEIGVGDDTQDSFSGNITWSPSGGTLYFDGADNGSATFAINANNVSVGIDQGSKGIYAGAYVPTRSGMRRILLLPPKNEATWVGVATGIDAAGEIVGYVTSGDGDGRAVRFFENGRARVLPVADAGVSASAQAINVHGDIVGNAGRQAFLFKNNHLTYLPRPPGETAGNAVAYAINACDEIVGTIVNGSRQTAFLYVDGRSYDLDSLLPANSGLGIASAVGINDSGQIVGTAYDANVYFGYSMKPRRLR